VLRNKSNKSRKLLSKLGQFISYYALYLSSEKIKEQNIAENKSKEKTIKNPYLSEIIKEMAPIYEEGRMDGFLLYIFGIAVRDSRRQGSGGIELNDLPPSRQILIESVLRYPCNW